MNRIALAALAALAATPALAHGGHDAASGLAAGFVHPLGGPDHLLAMAAVGIWSAATLPRRLVLAAPAAFVAAMLAGSGLAFAGIALPLVEGAIALSVLLLGLLVALRLKLPAAAGAALAAAFALFHGHAHGTEAAGDVAGYMAGFAAATAAIHVGGLAIGAEIARSRTAQALLGGGIALAGLGLVAG